MLGYEALPTSTENSMNIYNSWVENNCQPNFYQDLDGCNSTCGPYPNPNPSSNTELKQNHHEYHAWASKDQHDTIGMIALSMNGTMACGTSTNGASHKVRGRVGDSPIVGSGCYVDSTVGGCAATGDGDVMMRFLPSFAGVYEMRTGISPWNASYNALQPILRSFPAFSGI